MTCNREQHIHTIYNEAKIKGKSANDKNKCFIVWKQLFLSDSINLGKPKIPHQCKHLFGGTWQRNNVYDGLIKIKSMEVFTKNGKIIRGNNRQ